MESQAFPPLDISRYWANLTDHLVEIADAIPDDKMNWSPSADVWNFRGMFLHIAGARHHWMANSVKDGEETPDVLRGGQTKEGLKQQLRLSWERLARFLSDPQKLSAVYQPPPGDPPYDGDPSDFTGHWIAYHRLVHDAHHRADIFHLVASLGIAIPERRYRPL